MNQARGVRRDPGLDDGPTHHYGEQVAADRLNFWEFGHEVRIKEAEARSKGKRSELGRRK